MSVKNYNILRRYHICIKGLRVVLPVSSRQIWEKKWKLWETYIIAAVERHKVSTITRAIQNDSMTLRYVTKSQWRRHVFAILKKIRHFLIRFAKINTEAKRVPKRDFVQTFTLGTHANWQYFILVLSWLHCRILWFKNLYMWNVSFVSCFSPLCFLCIQTIMNVRGLSFLFASQ